MHIPDSALWAGLSALATACGAGFWAWLGKRTETGRSAPAAQTAADADLVTASGDLAKKFAEASVAMMQPVAAELATLRQRLDDSGAKHDAEMAVMRDDLRHCHDGHLACEAKYADLEQRFALHQALAPIPPHQPGLLLGQLKKPDAP